MKVRVFVMQRMSDGHFEGERTPNGRPTYTKSLDDASVCMVAPDIHEDTLQVREIEVEGKAKLMRKRRTKR